MDISKIKDLIQWDFELEDEFNKKRQIGFGFVIDIYNGKPHLALY